MPCQYMIGEDILSPERSYWAAAFDDVGNPETFRFELTADRI